MAPHIGSDLRIAHNILIAAAVVVGWSAAAQETGHSVPLQSEVNKAGLVERGRALYVRHCIHCHGIGMVAPGTVAFDLRRFPQNDKARFVQSVTRGKNDRMPPWGDILTEHEIEELWAYVLSGGAP
jgi:mono/diheme cytochrome c family protein